MKIAVICLIMGISFGVSAADAPLERWTQWRGQNRDSHADHLELPSDLGERHLIPAWRMPLGPGYSGPIVAEGMVFVTETVDKKYEVVRALDLATGKELWRAQWEGAMSVPFFARKNGSWIRATPAWAPGKLYVAGMEDYLVCLDTKDGRRVWHMDFPEKFEAPDPTFGFVSSPLVDGDHLYVQAGAAVMKLNRHNGETVWRSLEDKGGMMGSAFSSPILATFDGVRQLVVQTRTHLAGLSPQDGAVLWQREIPSFRGMNILTPTVYKEKIFTSNYKGRSYLFDLKRSGNDWALEQVWENKSMAYMSSPVIVGDYVFMHLQNKSANCIDLKTGEEEWRSSERFGDYWSMVAVKDKILALDSGGELLLMEANSAAPVVIDRRKVADQPSWAHLAVTQDGVFIRELEAIAMFAWSKSQPTLPTENPAGQD